MSHSMVDGDDPLHHDTPQHHQYHRPTIDGVLGDEFHIRWCPEIKHHDGGNIPKSQLVVKPEIPVDGDIAYQIDDTPSLRIEAWNIVERCHDEPRRQDAQQATTIETPGGRLLHPGEPKAYATKKEKYIDADIATATEAKKQIGAGQSHMEKDDEEHGGSHQFASETADICQFDVLGTHTIYRFGVGVSGLSIVALPTKHR